MSFWLWKKLRDDWIVKPRAAVVFLVCSVFVLVLIPVFFGHISQGGSVARQIFWGAVGAIGAPATLFLWIGMWRYWARVDASRNWAKRRWFAVMLVGFWYGSVLYCYFVYLPQVRRREA
jgi:hypothetical protein